jgi:hypothetical protein
MGVFVGTSDGGIAGMMKIRLHGEKHGITTDILENSLSMY